MSKVYMSKLTFYLSRTIGLVDLPIRMKGNSKCISGSSLNPLGAQNKELGVASQTLLTEAELRLRRRLTLGAQLRFSIWH